MSGEDYKLLGVDLSELSELERALEGAGLDSEAPTLFIAEVVLAYMENSRLVQVSSLSEMRTSCFVCTSPGDFRLMTGPQDSPGSPTQLLVTQSVLLGVLKGRRRQQQNLQGRV